MTFDLGVKVKENIAQFHLHHVTYATAKFEAVMSNSLGGDAFTRKYIIWPLTLTKVQWNIAQYLLHHVT